MPSRRPSGSSSSEAHSSTHALTRAYPRELLATHATLRTRPEVLRAIRTDGRATAKRFAWPRVLDGYEAAWETAFALTST